MLCFRPYPRLDTVGEFALSPFVVGERPCALPVGDHTTRVRQRYPIRVNKQMQSIGIKKRRPQGPPLSCLECGCFTVYGDAEASVKLYLL